MNTLRLPLFIGVNLLALCISSFNLQAHTQSSYHAYLKDNDYITFSLHIQNPLKPYLEKFNITTNTQLKETKAFLKSSWHELDALLKPLKTQIPVTPEMKALCKKMTRDHFKETAHKVSEIVKPALDTWEDKMEQIIIDQESKKELLKQKTDAVSAFVEEKIKHPVVQQTIKKVEREAQRLSQQISTFLKKHK